MNWQAPIDMSEIGTGTPPWTHNRTTDVVACQFDADDYQVTFIFRYDLSEMGWPAKYLVKGDYLFHLWVVTDNRGDGMDHVDLYTSLGDVAPETGTPATWGVQILNLDCRGVRVVK